jgi:2',3'-cyclic-nucleotide 2'-phosphodiesterase (5'-nucleotidase family)
VEAFKKKFKQTPVLQAEAGFFLYDSAGYPPLVMLQNEQVVRAYSRWPVDAINLGRFDLIYAQRLLALEGLAERTEAMPAIKNIISANGVFGSDVAAPAPFIVKEVTGPRIKGKGKKIRVGFVGLAEPIKPAEGVDATVKNMFDAARGVVPLARKQCDILVILAHSEFPAALRLARENPEADLVIAGNAEGAFNPQQVGKTLVVRAAPGNTQQGDIRVYVGQDGRYSFKFRSTDLDALVPSGPAAAAYTEEARAEMARARANLR